MTLLHVIRSRRSSSADPNSSFGHFDDLEPSEHLEPVSLQMLRVKLANIKETLNEQMTRQFSELVDEYRTWSTVGPDGSEKMRPKHFAPQGLFDSADAWQHINQCI